MGSLGLTCDQVKINFPVGLSENTVFQMLMTVCHLVDERHIDEEGNRDQHYTLWRRDDTSSALLSWQAFAKHPSMKTQ
jgi:hypothetical protein